MSLDDIAKSTTGTQLRARFPIRRRASASPSLCTASSRSLVKLATSSRFASYARTSRASSHFRYSARLSRSARFRRVAAAVSSCERVVASCVVVVVVVEEEETTTVLSLIHI